MSEGDGCKYLHENDPTGEAAKVAKPSPKAKAEKAAKSEKAPESPAENAKTLCSFFKKGKCRNGDSCTFSHAKSKSPSKSPGGTPKRKPSPKGKARAER